MPLVEEHADERGEEAIATKTTRASSAPLGIRFETPEQIEARADDIERQAVLTRAMPPGNATGMTDGERELLGAWIAQTR